MLAVKVSEKDGQSYVRRTFLADEVPGLIEDARQKFAGMGCLVTVHGRGDPRATGDFVVIEST